MNSLLETYDADTEADLAEVVTRGLVNAFDQLAPAYEASAERRTELPLADWCRRYLPLHFLKPPSGLHNWLFEQCDLSRRQRGRKVNLIGPRGGAKSTIGSLAYPLRCALEGTEPLIWLVSNVAGQAETNLHNLQSEIVDNDLIARDYPHVAGRGRLWCRDKIKLRNGVVVEAFGTGQKLRGRRERQSRPSLIICDDLQGDNVMISATAREKEQAWFDGTLMKAGNRATNFVSLATALHRDAIAMKLERTPGWISRAFRAIEEWPGNMGLWEQWAELYHDMDAPDRLAKATEFYEQRGAEMQAGAKLLWPEEESLLDLMRMREDDGRGTFEREKQSRPINPEACEWPESYFDDHAWFEDWPTTWQVKTMALDPSKGKDARRSDYSAFVMLQITDGILYVDADLARRPTPQMVSDGCTLVRRFRPDAFAVEANAWQDLLCGEFEREMRSQGLLACRPQGLMNTLNKLVRIRRLGPFMAQHRVRFKRGSAGALLLVSQLKDFPDRNSHDDGPDALEMAERLAELMLYGDVADGPQAGSLARKN